MANGNLSHSMRENYGTHGVAEYYKIVQESYRNPHFPGLKKVLAQFLDRYVAQEKPKSIKVLDLAAGSGEATEAILAWKASRWPKTDTTALATTEPARQPEEAPSATVPPSQTSQASRPLALPIRQPFIPPSRNPSARPAVRPNRPQTAPAASEPELSIVASDPFTSPAYRARVGLPCLELSFTDVAAGKLPAPGSTEAPGEGDDEVELYDIVVISFALHLVESSSEMWALLAELGKRTRWLVITAPHKKPEIKSSWGWRRWNPSAWCPAEGRGDVGGVEGDGYEIVLDRVDLLSDPTSSPPSPHSRLTHVSLNSLTGATHAAGMTATPPQPAKAPGRVLLLLDGDHTLPECDSLIRGAQGGSLAAHSLHHRLKLWASSEMGRGCQTSVHVFGDVAQLAKSLRIPAEILHNFVRGFSSTPAPSAFSNVLQSSTLSHLGFTAPLVDAVVLVGWYTDMHAHWLGRLISAGVVDPSRLALVETAHPLAKSVARLVTRRVKLGDFTDVLPVVKDITDPPSDVEEGEGLEAETMAAGPPPGLAMPVGERLATPSFEPALPEEGLTPRAATPAARPATRSPQSPPQPAPEVPQTPSPTVASVPPRPATAPAASQREEVAQPPSLPPTPEATPEPATTPPPAAKPSKVAFPRAPPVPPQYEPLLRILIALQAPSPAGVVPPAPLWSAVGNELQKSELKGRYGKLTAYMLAAQKDGWVVTGKGETEGSEWVKISQRGLRAMGKKPVR
ncbi:hypothetical protein RTBOTA2_002600 [Rhodotorula toruloides]|nr:hypothetical protein RTBOTA2_002600 [Rhodotorula toruloides]